MLTQYTHLQKALEMTLSGLPSDTIVTLYIFKRIVVLANSLAEKDKAITNDNNLSLIKICEQVATDVETDAKEFDGKPFDGKTVAIYFGYHGAAIKALADVVKQLVDKNNKP